MSLELKVPPPVVMLLCMGGMFVLREVLPGPALPLSHSLARVLASCLVGLGIAVALLGVLEFLRARTTVDPHRPEKSTTLVSGGVYRLTRNPMYLGMLLCLLAFFLYLRSAPAVLLLPCFVLYLNRFQIAPEERVMQERFGEAYADYRGRVRRWI